MPLPFTAHSRVQEASYAVSVSEGACMILSATISQQSIRHTRKGTLVGPAAVWTEYLTCSLPATMLPQHVPVVTHDCHPWQLWTDNDARFQNGVYNSKLTEVRYSFSDCAAVQAECICVEMRDSAFRVLCGRHDSFPVCACPAKLMYACTRA